MNVNGVVVQPWLPIAAKPVDIAQGERAPLQSAARPGRDPPRGGVDRDDIERLARRHAQTPPLPDGEVDDAAVAAEHPPLAIDDLAGLRGLRTQLRHHVLVAPVGHEADVLAVGLLRHVKPEGGGHRAHLVLGESAKREAHEVELLLGGGVKEVALVAAHVVGREQAAVAAAVERPRHRVVSGGERGGPQRPRLRQKIGELHRLVALDARHGRFAGEVAVGETVDDAFAEPALVVEDEMRDAEAAGGAAGVMDVLPRAARSLAPQRRAVVVELERQADDGVTRVMQKRCGDAGVDPAGHGDGDTVAAGVSRKRHRLAHRRNRLPVHHAAPVR